MEGYGQLSPSGEEFVIGRPDTPQPWFNLLTNGGYLLQIAQSGLARFASDSAQPTESSWRFLYIRDSDTGEIWSLTVYPVGGSYDSFECRHGVGQTNFKLIKNQIELAATVFVPNNFDGEVWRVAVKNLSTEKRRLELFMTAGLPSTISEVGPDKGIIIGRSRLDPAHLHFGAADRPYDSFDCRAETFFGIYGSQSRPEIVASGKCARSLAANESGVIVMEHNLTLGKNVSTHINYFLGVTEDLSATRQSIAQFKKPDGLEKSYQSTLKDWRNRSDHVTIRTPDPSLNQSFNNHWKYQVLAPQSGSVKQQIYRLINSLALGQTSQADLVNVLSQQAKDGQVESIEATLGLIRLVIGYVKETGLMSVFSEQAAYLDSGHGTILQHFIRALSFTESQLSERGLVLLKLPGQQQFESAKLTGMLASSWRESLPILAHFGEHYLVDRYTKLLERLKQSVSRHLKQGRYFSAGIHSKLGKFGSKTKSCQVDANAQAWLIIGGLVDAANSTSALAVVRQKLSTKYGVLNFAPAFPIAVEGITESVDSPGSGQNSSVSTQTAAALIGAKTSLGLGDDSYKMLEPILPLNQIKRLDAYGAEPYAIPEAIYGPDHPRFGQGMSDWSGVGVGQLWSVALQDIFGIKPVLGGLKIDPCLPKDWRQVEVTRQFRGADYHIRIQNPFRVNKGIDRILVDGVRLTGSVIRPFNAGSHFVEVTLG